MLSKRLLLVWLTMVLVTAGGRVDAQSQTGFRDLDKKARILKRVFLRLNADLFTLADELSYPAKRRLTISLSIHTSAPLRLHDVQLQIDKRVVTYHRYTQLDLDALFHGGIQRLYTGNLTEGEHELNAVVTGKTPNGREYRQSTLLVFYKKAGPKFLQLKVVKPIGKRQPDLRLPGSVNYRELSGIKDLEFGEALFDFHRKRYFSATTGLIAAQTKQKLQYHEKEARWLLADLYLSYGLHRQAGRIFSSVSAQGVPSDVAARANFYIAKDWYQRGYLKRAQDALLRSRESLPIELQDERLLLLALVLMKRNRYGEGVAVLSQFIDKSEWAAYARYNMGVGLIQIGRLKEGATLLEKVAKLRSKKSEMQMLRDKANLALGFVFLGVPKPQRARSYFREVSLNGPLSNRALLGMGWALSARGKHKQSLGPWLELHKRTDIDVAVQESLLAVPYALSELGAYKQALQHYENAITVYNAEIDRLGQAVGLLRAGELLASVVSDNPNYGPEMRTKLSDLAESHYLVSLFVAHDFQETLRNYRAMQSISQNLGCWSATLAREKQHDLPTQLAKAKQAMTGADEALDAVDSSQWCGRLNASHRWQLSENFEPSLWLSREARDQLSWRAGDGASATETVIEEEETVAEKQERLKAYSAAFGERVAQLHAEVNRVMHSHALYLQQLVATELDRQRKQLRSYLTQARFGIAQVYDRSAGLTETR